MSLPSSLPKDQQNLEKVELYSKDQDEEQMLELLAYYRSKADNQEKERIEWMAEVEQMKQNVHNVHEQEESIFNIKH